MCITQLSEDLFAIGSDAGTISIWSTVYFANISNFHTNKRSITFIEMLEKDKIICGAWDNALFIIDLKTNSIEEIETDQHIPRHGIALSKECVITISNSIYLSKKGSSDATLRVWDLHTKKFNILSHNKNISCVKKLTQNELIIGKSDGTISIMNIQEKKCINYLSIKDHSIRDILANGDIITCTRLGFGFEDKLVFWRKNGSEFIQKVVLPDDFVNITLLKNGNIFLLQTPWDPKYRKNRFLILEKETFKKLNSIYIPHSPNASCILSNGQFVIGTNDGNLQLHRFAIAPNKNNHEMNQVEIDNEKNGSSHSRKCSIQ